MVNGEEELKLFVTVTVIMLFSKNLRNSIMLTSQSITDSRNILVINLKKSIVGKVGNKKKRQIHADISTISSVFDL